MPGMGEQGGGGGAYRLGRGMQVLLSSENFDGFSGTETYVLTVARQLERLGHQASIETKCTQRMAIGGG